MPRDWRDSSGEEAWISSFLFRERCREDEEEEEDDEMAREMVSLSCCNEQELGTSIFRVSLDSRDRSLSFISFFLFFFLFPNWISVQWKERKRGTTKQDANVADSAPSNFRWTMAL